MTVAIQKKGIDELLGAIDEYVRTAQKDGRLEEQRRERLKRKVFRILTNRFQREFVERMSANGELAATLDKIANGEANPFTVGDELYTRFTRQ
ncbi:MAG: hypothetical protein D6800_09945 [Candidatus Zixiibacteriota bacterium]|nr:MAG: hypothetical protein D6800_09945 [candidate division Zixibacteria bacterium]